MEMKYLVEQDTDKVYLPVVHVDSIIGLDPINKPNIVSVVTKKTIDLTRANLGIRGTMTISEFNELSYIDLDIEITSTTIDNNFYDRLLRGESVVIDIDPNLVGKTYSNTTFDIVCYDGSGAISEEIVTHVRYTPLSLIIKADLKKKVYNIINGILQSRDVTLTLSRMIGSANGFLVGEEAGH